MCAPAGRQLHSAEHLAPPSTWRFALADHVPEHIMPEHTHTIKNVSNVNADSGQ